MGARCRRSVPIRRSEPRLAAHSRTTRAARRAAGSERLDGRRRRARSRLGTFRPDDARPFRPPGKSDYRSAIPRTRPRTQSHPGGIREGSCSRTERSPPGGRGRQRTGSEGLPTSWVRRNRGSRASRVRSDGISDLRSPVRRTTPNGSAPQPSGQFATQRGRGGSVTEDNRLSTHPGPASFRVSSGRRSRMSSVTSPSSGDRRKDAVQDS